MKANQDTNRDSFVLYKSFYEPVSGLMDDQLGRLFRAIFQWQITGTADQDPDDVVNMALGFIINQFRIDNGKYLERCEKNRANGMLGGRPKKNQSVNEKPDGFEKTHNDNDNDNGNDNVFGGPGGETPVRKKRTFAKPSLSDVEAYCLERANGIDPAAFIDHYEANGWMVGKNKMRDWKAAIRTWERNRGKVPTPSNQGPNTGKVITDIDELFKD